MSKVRVASPEPSTYSSANGKAPQPQDYTVVPTSLDNAATLLGIDVATLRQLTARQMQLLLAMRAVEAGRPGLPVNLAYIAGELDLSINTISGHHQSLIARLKASGDLQALPMTTHDPRWRMVVELAIRECGSTTTQANLAEQLGMGPKALGHHSQRLSQEGPSIDPELPREEVVAGLLRSGVSQAAIANALQIAPELLTTTSGPAPSGELG